MLVSRKPKRILEIGTALGYSALMWRKACPDAEIICIDVDEELCKKAMKNFEIAKANITLINGQAQKEIPKLKGEFDFVFLDAMMKDYAHYMILIEPLLAKNALIVADNITSHKKQSEDYIEYMKKYNTELVSIGKGLLIST